MKWYLFDRNQWQCDMNTNRTSNNTNEFAIHKFESWSICKPLYFNRTHHVEISFEIWSTASQGNSLSFSTFLDCSYSLRSLARIEIKRILFVNTKWKFKNVWYSPEVLWLDERKKEKNIKDDSLLEDELRDIRFVLRFFVTSHNPPILRNFSDSNIRTQ